MARSTPSDIGIGAVPTKAPLQWLFSAPGRALEWLLRVDKARRELAVLAAMSEAELKDIGLSRADIGDATALPADASPTDFLAMRVDERQRATACG